MIHPRIRLADPERDAAAIAEIYRPEVERGVASFEEVAPDAPEMARRIRSVLAWAPWLVADDPDGLVLGYAYATRHRDRPAYRWAVDLSVYVHPDHHGQGIGRALYEALLPMLRLQGFLRAYAGVTTPNPASIRLHEQMGMRSFATFRDVGWKLGAWWPVVWLELQLVEVLPESPPEPVPLPAILATSAGRARLGGLMGS